MASSTLKHRLTGFLTVDVPEGPGRFRLVGQLLKLLAVGALLVFLGAAAAFTLGFVIVLGIGILGAWAWNLFTPWSVSVPPWEWTTLAPLAYPVLALLAFGVLITLAMNHVVLWWARAHARGLWGARAAGVGAVLVGGGLGRSVLVEGLTGSVSLLGLALTAGGLAVVVLTLEPATRQAFETRTDRTVEPVEP